MIFCPKTYSFSSKTLALVAASGFYRQWGGPKKRWKPMETRGTWWFNQEQLFTFGILWLSSKNQVAWNMLVHNKVKDFPHKNLTVTGLILILTKWLKTVLDQWALQSNRHNSGRARNGETIGQKLGESTRLRIDISGENSAGNHLIWISWFSPKKSDMMW